MFPATACRFLLICLFCYLYQQQRRCNLKSKEFLMEMVKTVLCSNVSVLYIIEWCPIIHSKGNGDGEWEAALFRWVHGAAQVKKDLWRLSYPTVPWSRLHGIQKFRCSLGISRAGCSITSLHRLCQCSVALTARRVGVCPGASVLCNSWESPDTWLGLDRELPALPARWNHFHWLCDTQRASPAMCSQVHHCEPSLL